MSSSSSSRGSSRSRVRFPNTNAHPTPQAITQVTGYPDYESLKKSYNYYERVISNNKGVITKGNFFTPKNVQVDDMTDVLSIDQYDPVFCLKKDLIGTFSGESDSFHSSAQVNMIKIRSTFNNLFIDGLTEAFIQDLMDTIFCVNNERYIAELVSFMIHPVGVAKTKFSFDPSKRAKLALTPLELENSGTISSKVQDKKSYLYCGTRVRWCVPTPTQWNDSGNWYTDKDIKGKISLYVEPITIENDTAKFASLFSGFFGNDMYKVEDYLQELIDCGHDCLVPFHAIPTSFKHLISVIYLKTIQMDIETGLVEVNNPYKYQSIAAFFQGLMEQLKANGANTQQMFEVILQDVKKESRVQTANVLISTYVKYIDASYPIDVLQRMVIDIYNAMDGGVDTRNNFVVEIYDLPDNFEYDFAPGEGFSETEWDELLKKHGEKVLNWTRPLIYESDQRMKKPISTNNLEFTHPGRFGMFGDYILKTETPITPGMNDLIEMSSSNATEIRKAAAEDFVIAAAPLFGLAVPVPAKGDASSRSGADGYMYAHHEDPDFQIMTADATNRADRAVTEIALTLCSEILPQHKCERSRVGYDHSTSSNLSMTVEISSRHHVFNKNTDIGVVAKEISTVMPEFLQAMAEYFYVEEEKPKLKVIRGGSKGEKATVYFKQ